MLHLAIAGATMRRECRLCGTRSSGRLEYEDRGTVMRKIHVRRSLIAAALVSAAASLAAGPVEAPFVAENDAAMKRMMAAMAITPSGDVDTDFVAMMIPHHQGAIDMALVLLKYGHDEKLRRLAQSIIVEQGQEIAYMRMLLGAPAADPSTTDHAADH
jgi:Domain of unknown function (DUF305)